ncbi:hypothetical protein AB0G87_38315 [Streptomyces asoensis]|uniref:hypothetical protein n=1 Tax=Streptomyces asoensis TaxID=249586 RepID=UPI0033EAA6AC
MPAARDTVVRSRAASRSNAKYAGSGRERLYLLRVYEDAIMLHAMRWSDEVRDPEGALAVMGTMGPRGPREGGFRDSCTQCRRQDHRVQAGVQQLPEALEPKEQVLDLMAAPQDSAERSSPPRDRRCRWRPRA